MKQFSLLEDFSKKNEEIIDIKLGNTFILVLSHSGKVYFKGAISQEGVEKINSFNEFVCLNDRMGRKDEFVPDFAKGKLWKDYLEKWGESTEQDKFFFTKIEAGFSHAVFLDDQNRVFTFGGGFYG